MYIYIYIHTFTSIYTYPHILHRTFMHTFIHINTYIDMAYIYYIHTIIYIYILPKYIHKFSRSNYPEWIRG